VLEEGLGPSKVIWQGRTEDKHPWAEAWGREKHVLFGGGWSFSFLGLGLEPLMLTQTLPLSSALSPGGWLAFSVLFRFVLFRGSGV
jgi:hypothetical protein